MPEKKFQRKTEDFICENCQTIVLGNGYTDHCPNCLWSKHVDINPGDRKSHCGGLMEAQGLKIKGGDYIIHYRCRRCGYQHKVKAAKKDNFSEILKLSKKILKVD